MIPRQTTSQYVAAKESNPGRWKRTIDPFLEEVRRFVLHCVPFGLTHDLVEPGYRAREVVPGSPFAIERLARLNPYAVAFRYGEPPADRVEPEEAEEIVASVTEWAGACILAVAEHADGSW